MKDSILNPHPVFWTQTRLACTMISKQWYTQIHICILGKIPRKLRFILHLHIMAPRLVSKKFCLVQYLVLSIKYILIEGLHRTVTRANVVKLLYSQIVWKLLISESVSFLSLQSLRYVCFVVSKCNHALLFVVVGSF